MISLLSNYLEIVTADMDGCFCTCMTLMSGSALSIQGFLVNEVLLQAHF